jgi:hypothetical protein
MSINEVRHPQHQEITAAAKIVANILSNALPGEDLGGATAFVVAEVLKAQDSERFELMNFTLEHLLNVYVGQALTDRLPRYLELHAQLEREGAISYASRREFLRSEYSVYALPTVMHTVPGKVVVKAMVLNTLEGNYLVVLNERFGQWTVHFRQFWPELSEALASSDWIVGLEEHRKADNLTLLDVAKLSKAMSNFADDYPGVIAPSRPSLASFMAGKLIPHEDGEGPGLSYGDGRDAGFIASLVNHPTPLAYDVGHATLPMVHLVAKLLRQAESPLQD